MKRVVMVLAAVVLSGCVINQPAAISPSVTPLPTLTPFPTATPTPIPPRPVSLVIPKLKVQAPIQEVGLDASGRMAVPSGWWNVGWYAYGPVPGERGSAVIDGHLDSTTGPAVFWNLKLLKAGDEVQVIDQAGRRLRFVVERVSVFADNTFPINTVFAQTDGKRLNLITCEGSFDQRSNNYSDRLVVFTRLIE